MADQSKVSFGLGQVNNETPLFAQWIFRGYFLISKAVLGWLGGLAAAGALSIPVKTMLLISLTISLLLDPIMLGFSKLFGIVPEPVDPTKPFLATQQMDQQGDVNAIPDTKLPPQPVPESAGKPDFK